MTFTNCSTTGHDPHCLAQNRAAAALGCQDNPLVKPWEARTRKWKLSFWPAMRMKSGVWRYTTGLPQHSGHGIVPARIGLGFGTRLRHHKTHCD